MNHFQSFVRQGSSLFGNPSDAESAIAAQAFGKRAGANITIGAGLDAISSTRGAILYRGASGWAGRNPSAITSGYYLMNQGTGADPSWFPASGQIAYFCSEPISETTILANAVGLIFDELNLDLGTEVILNGGSEINVLIDTTNGNPSVPRHRIQPTQSIVVNTNEQVITCTEFILISGVEEMLAAGAEHILLP